MRNRYLPRSAPGSFDHRVNAAAGRLHRTVDVGGAASATSASGSPVEGSTVVKRRPSIGSTKSPPMNRP